MNNPHEYLILDPTGRLPRALSRIRRKYLAEAKAMNGNSFCLLPSGVKEIHFLYEGVHCAVCRETFGMDWDVFNCNESDIWDDLEAIGCKMIGYVEDKLE